jgi:hypothetical protein
MSKDLTFRRRILNWTEEILKVFLHLPPPLEGEILAGLLNNKIPKRIVLSIPKMTL